MKREIIDASQLELVDQVVDIKRVTKVVKGGRNMRFTALVVVGDKNGHVGAGLGKAAEIPEAIRKGKEDAIKSLISVKLDENNSITHDVTGKYTGASVLLKKSPEGTGIIAGGPARSVCELAGITNIFKYNTNQRATKVAVFRIFSYKQVVILVFCDFFHLFRHFPRICHRIGKLRQKWVQLRNIVQFGFTVNNTHFASPFCSKNNGFLVIVPP